MKKIGLARTLLGLAVLTLIGVTALAEDNSKSTITINGGRQTVYMKAPSHVDAKKPCTPATFYDNICNGNINIGSGWTISDGSPINTEYTPGNQIISLAGGTTTKISVAVGFVEGGNGGIIDLDADCSGVPCGGTNGGKHLCQGRIKNLYTFGDTVVPETFKCVATLTKGNPYWVYVRTGGSGRANAWLAWNLSEVATGGFIEGTNDVWGTPSSGQSVGGLAIY